MSIDVKVLEAFQKAGKPLNAKEVAAITGIEKTEVDKVIKKLKAGDMIESPKRCYYQAK